MSGMVLGTVVAAADVASDFTVVRHDVARQKTLQICNEIVREAGKLMVDGDFDAAIKKYQQVVIKLDQPKTAELYAAKIQFCRDQIKRCYSLKAEYAMKKADKSASVGDFENAIKLLREAIKYYPEMREDLSKKIVFYEKRRDAAINREETSIEKLQPQLDAQEYQVQVLLEQGRASARRGDLMTSKRKFEEVLLIDPFNAEANQNLLGVNTRIRKAAELIVYSDLTLTQVAQMCGYVSTSHFNRVFARCVGLPPGQCRRAFSFDLHTGGKQTRRTPDSFMYSVLAGKSISPRTIDSFEADGRLTEE